MIVTVQYNICTSIVTPAGQVFVNQARLSWRRFTDTTDLSRQVQRVLAEHLLQYAIRYALTPAEAEKAEAPAEREVADHSAVILSRERFVPREGVMVDEFGVNQEET